MLIRQNISNTSFVPYIITDNHIILYGEYDPDQYWLPFMKGVCISTSRPPHIEQQIEKEFQQKKREKRRKSYKEPLVRSILKKDKHMVIFEPNQYNFQFVEWKELLLGGSLSEIAPYETYPKKAGWPGWVSDQNGVRITYTAVRNQESAKQWCQKNCRAMYTFIDWSNPCASFQNKHDAAAFKMLFC